MPSAPFGIDSTFGTLFIGAAFANTLYGVSIVQAFYYYRHQRDKWPIITLVTAVMVCNTVHQAIILHAVYTYAITDWGNQEMLGRLVPSLIIENVPNSLIALLVQSYLTARVWRFSKGNIPLTITIVAFVLAQFFSVGAFTIKAVQMQTLLQLLTLKVLCLSVNILAAVGDGLIAVALCFLLHRSRTGFHRSDSMINILILFAVNTGLITSLCALASFITYLSASHTFLHVAIYFSIGRLYTNSLLAILNARKMIRNASDNIHNFPTDNNVRVSLRDLPKSASTSKMQDHESDRVEYSEGPTKNAVVDLEAGQ